VNKTFFYTYTRMFITRDGRLVVGVRDTYRNGKYLYSQLSKESAPTWDRHHRLAQLKIPLIPYFETMTIFESIGEI